MMSPSSASARELRRTGGNCETRIQFTRPPCEAVAASEYCEAMLEKLAFWPRASIILFAS